MLTEALVVTAKSENQPRDPTTEKEVECFSAIENKAMAFFWDNAYSQR